MELSLEQWRVVVVLVHGIHLLQVLVDVMAVEEDQDKHVIQVQMFLLFKEKLYLEEAVVDQVVLVLLVLLVQVVQALYL